MTLFSVTYSQGDQRCADVGRRIQLGPSVSTYKLRDINWKSSVFAHHFLNIVLSQKYYLIILIQRNTEWKAKSSKQGLTIHHPPQNKIITTSLW